MNVTWLPMDCVRQNIGQIEGLPANPRQWTQTDIDRLARSLEETPELFEARPLIVYPLADEYIILGGNLRYEGAKKNGMEEVPCYVLPAMSVEKMKEIVIKDNGSFGDWDMDALANEWDDLPLSEWGIPVWHNEDVDMSAVDALFEESGASSKDKEITLTIVIPKAYEDKQEDIAKAVEITLLEWAGCIVK